MGDAHEVVVDDICKVIGRQSVTLYEHLIVKGLVLNGDIAENFVMEGGRALLGDALADDMRFTGGGTAVALLLAHAAAGVGDLFKACILVSLALFAEAAVGAALFDQKLGVFAVKPAALGLDIRAYGASDIRAFVVIKAALCQRAVDYIDCTLDEALLVGILDAQDKLALVVAGDEPCVQRRS